MGEKRRACKKIFEQAINQNDENLETKTNEDNLKKFFDRIHLFSQFFEVNRQ